MDRVRLTRILILLLVTASPIAAQTSTGFTVSIRGGVPDPENLFVDRPVVGAMAVYRTHRGLLFGIDYLYVGKDYYFFDGGSWSGPTEWRAVPAGSSGRSDWIFYRTRQVVSPFVGAGFPLGPVGLYATIGMNFSFVVLSDARTAYPAFSAAADNSPPMISPSFRGGIRWPARSLFGFQLGYLWSSEDALVLFGVGFDSGGRRGTGGDR